MVDVRSQTCSREYDHVALTAAGPGGVVRTEGEPQRRPRKVRVAGRDEIGEVIDEGKNIGSVINLYCVGVHFPGTGEVVYYDETRVETIE